MKQILSGNTDIFLKCTLVISLFAILISCTKEEEINKQLGVDDVGEYSCYEVTPSSASVMFLLKTNDLMQLYANYGVSNENGISYKAKCKIEYENLVLLEITEINGSSDDLKNVPEIGDIVGYIKKNKNGDLYMSTWGATCSMYKS